MGSYYVNVKNEKLLRDKHHNNDKTFVFRCSLRAKVTGEVRVKPVFLKLH